jgi:hypothetical protein
MLSFAPLLLPIVLFGPVVAPTAESALLEAPTRHVRATDAPMRSALRRGYRQSPSFAGLLARLQQSDIYVYVEEVARLPDSLEGRLMMLPIAHGHRYVRIQVTTRGTPDDAIAVLGHELQHAVEVAEDVVDQGTLARLYRRIGMRGGDHLYDTAAAQQMGRTVRRELSS